jgi:sporulation protein YlmC with PRC-barrel domain
VSRLCLSDLQRLHVVTEDGERIGHVFDIASRLEQPDQPPVLETLLIGRGGLARRLGVGRGRVTEVAIGDVVRIGDGEIVVRRQART